MEGSGRTVLACPTTSRKRSDQPSRHPSRPTAGSPDPDRAEFVAPRLAPGGLLACHGIHRPPGPKGRADRPARQSQESRVMTEATVSFAGNLTDDPRSATPTAASPERPSGWPCPVGGSRRRHCSPSSCGATKPSMRAVPVEGSRVVVVGRLLQRAWTAEDGSTRQLVEVVADELGPSNCAGQRRPRPGRGEARHSSHVEHQRALPALLPPPGLHLRPHRRPAHNPSGALFQRPAQRVSTPRPQESGLLATADRLSKQDREASCDQPPFTDEGIQAGLRKLDPSDQAMRPHDLG